MDLISYTVTNVVPLNSVHQAPPYEHIITLLTPFPTEFVYLRCSALPAEFVKSLGNGLFRQGGLLEEVPTDRFHSDGRPIRCSK